MVANRPRQRHHRRKRERERDRLIYTDQQSRLTFGAVEQRDKSKFEREREREREMMGVSERETLRV